MREILNSFVRPLSGVGGTSLSGQNDLSLLGLKLDDRSFLQLDEALLAKSTSLQSTLASGIRIGYDATAVKDLSRKITDMLAIGGLLSERVTRERNNQAQLTSRKALVEDRLITVQARLTAQFAALDALLFRLNNTSEALKSALDGLVNSQRKG
jgi:flagellar hook-associated protein 2